ncbi:MAG: ACT domain-containing protein [Lachnospiraceae bacterium]|jgi:ACT domain-containing protein|nr:ACT domain-containing protein [Lachnospiraceae bacterium]
MEKIIITVVGKDTVGIIARVCTYLADNGINILDISQTIVQGFFNMMMIVDAKEAKVSFDEMTGGLNAVGEQMGVRIRCQREEIFTKMHRI